MFERMRWGERELPQAAGRIPPAIAAAIVAIAMVLTFILMAGCQNAPEASSQGTPDAGDKSPDPSSTAKAPLGQDVPGGTSSSAPGVGDIAPDFSLPNTNGGQTSLSEVLARNDSVVLVFYRGFF